MLKGLLTINQKNPCEEESPLPGFQLRKVSLYFSFMGDTGLITLIHVLDKIK